MEYRIKYRIHGEPDVEYMCPSCGTPLINTLKDAGKEDTCPSCKITLVVPGKEDLVHLEKKEKQRKQVKIEADEKVRRLNKEKQVRKQKEKEADQLFRKLKSEDATKQNSDDRKVKTLTPILRGRMDDMVNLVWDVIWWYLAISGAAYVVFGILLTNQMMKEPDSWNGPAAFGLVFGLVAFVGLSTYVGLVLPWKFIIHREQNQQLRFEILLKQFLISNPQEGSEENEEQIN